MLRLTLSQAGKSRGVAARLGEVLGPGWGSAAGGSAAADAAAAATASCSYAPARLASSSSTSTTSKQWDLLHRQVRLEHFCLETHSLTPQYRSPVLIPPSPPCRVTTSIPATAACTPPTPRLASSLRTRRSCQSRRPTPPSRPALGAAPPRQTACAYVVSAAPAAWRPPSS